ncbi:MAG: hypothetical protein CL915_11150 [Deltaproteobacteria bacterium]|nr:hypothetical protein [Deltaproteobacteria bacterium]
MDRLANKIHAIGRRKIVLLRNIHHTAVVIDVIPLQHRVRIGAKQDDGPMQVVWTHRWLGVSGLAIAVRTHPARPNAVCMVLIKLIRWGLHLQVLLFLLRWFYFGWLAKVS